MGGDMEGIEFQEYLAKFEHYVIKQAISQGLLGTKAWMPIRDGRLTRTPLADLVGTRFTSKVPAVLEYYGLHKRSTGFMEKAGRLLEFGKKGFECIVVNLSSVKDSLIADLAPELLPRFPAFKQAIIAVRFDKY
jgi:hypothetical protein